MRKLPFGFAAFLLVAGLLQCGCTSPPSTRGAEEGGAGLGVRVRKVEMPYRVCVKPQRVGRYLYANVSRGVDQGDSLIRYDLESEATETIVEAPDPNLIGWFVVNEDWLAWSVGPDLFAMYLATGDTHLVHSSFDLIAPDLRGDLLAWTDTAEFASHKVMRSDLRTRETTVVADLALPELYNNFPTWDGDRLVWTDVVDDRGYYHVFDASTGEREEYVLSGTTFRYPGYAEASGDCIYSINFDRVREWDWTVQRFGYYSVPERRFVPIMPDGVVVNAFELGHGFVAVIDDEQQLTLWPVGQADERCESPVGGRVDHVQASCDGAVIAVRDGLGDSDPCELFLIEPPE